MIWKEKINNSDLIPFARTATKDALVQWITDKPKEAKKIGDMIKKMAKIRQEGQKVRQSALPKHANVFTVNEKKYTRATGKKDLELIIIEGDSAAGTTKQGRDEEFQEVYAMKGVPLNTYGMDILNINKNEELRSLAIIMGCGLGKKHNPDKAKHERYIIATDADIDGNRITSILSVFFLCHCPGLVEQGRVYKMIPPLYSLGDKKTINGSRYIQNTKQLNSIIQKEICKGNKIVSRTTKKELKEKDIKKLLEINSGYHRELIRMSNKLAVNPIILEFVLAHSDKTQKALAKLLNKEYSFIDATVSGKKILVEGIFDKEFQYAVIDEKMLKKCKVVKSLIDLNNKHYGIEFKLNGEDKSLFQLLNDFKKFTPKMTRFKGLGEMNEDQLWETSLDPENRQLVRLTTDDLKRDVERFALLHSKKKKSVEERAKMFESFKITIDDIDN